MFIVFHTEPDSLILTVSNACKFGFNLQHNRFNKSNRNSFKSIFAHSLVIPSVLLPLAFAVTPFTFSHHPLKRSLVVKMLSGLWYGICGLYGGLCVIAMLMTMIIFAKNLIEFTNEMVKYNHLRINTNLFAKTCNDYRIAQILIYCCDTTFIPFTMNLIFIGILFASCGAYWTIEM